MGKTSLAYYYCQKWAKDELKAFDAVAFVRLRDLCVREDDTRPLHTLSSLLFLASGNEIELSKESCHHLVTNWKFLLILDGWDEVQISPCFAGICFFSDGDTHHLTTQVIFMAKSIM